VLATEARLATAERAALARLNAAARRAAPALRGALARAARLDVACARARLGLAMVERGDGAQSVEKLAVSRARRVDRDGYVPWGVGPPTRR